MNIIFPLWNEIINSNHLSFSLIDIAIYIYYVIIITKTVFPFILFNVIVIIAFAHTMY
jgi:hypothetical protein